MHKSQNGRLAVPLLLCLGLALAGCSHTSSDWKDAQKADTTEAYQEFLRLHPDTEFTSKARERIAAIAEQRDWERAVNDGTVDGYQQFLAAHADGLNAPEARVRIENLQLAATPAPATAAPPAAAPGAPAGKAPEATAPAGKPPVAKAPAAKVPAAKAPAAKAPQPPAAAKPAPAGKHLVQLGAFGSRAAAAAAWDKASARFGAQLGGLQPHYASARSHGKAIVRLQVRVASREAGKALCAQLKKQKQACVVAG